MDEGGKSISRLSVEEDVQTDKTGRTIARDVVIE